MKATADPIVGSGRWWAYCMAHATVVTSDFFKTDSLAPSCMCVRTVVYEYKQKKKILNTHV